MATTPPTPAPPETYTIAVIGAGAMGRGIASVAAAAGHPVQLYDAAPGTAAGAVETLHADYERLVSRNKLTADEARARLARITPVESIGTLAGAVLVVEAIVENLPIKQELFKQLEAIVGADTILTTNTSSLSITALAGSLKHPARFAGLHFFNPAPVMPLVEVVKGAATSARVVEELVATAKRWGKVPVVCGSSPGFIVNRVARPFYGEAMRLLEERAATPATLDALLRDSGGFKMGPCELTDLIGQDVNFAVTQSVYQGFFNDPRYQPSLVQQELVLAGHLGRKTGQGFYPYGEGAAVPEPACEAEGPYPHSVEVRGDLGPASVLAEMAEAAGIPVARIGCGHIEPGSRTAAGPVARRSEEGSCHTNGQRRDGNTTESEPISSLHVDGIRLLLTDGKLAAEHSSAAGPTILFDLALDYRQAKRIAIAVPDGLPPEHAARAAGFFQALGKQVTVVDDVAGMVVMRTVAMLINEAIDALHQGVASAEAIDLAMTAGVNYPLGPLAWADRLGAPRLLRVLENLARISPDGRYRPSPLLRRRAKREAGKENSSREGRGCERVARNKNLDVGENA